VTPHAFQDAQISPEVHVLASGEKRGGAN
jgi:hypothetical protein